MGWANCGHDSTGRPIGYAHSATCDEPGCKARIHRGLAYACGGMHGEEDSCEKYFCDEHLSGTIMLRDGPKPEYKRVCKACETAWREEFPEDAADLDGE